MRATETVRIRLRNAGREVKISWPMLVAVPVPVLILFSARKWVPSEDQPLQWAGLALQLASLAMVWLGIRRLSARFKEPMPMKRLFFLWMRLFEILFRPRSITVDVEPLSLIFSAGGARAKLAAPEGASLERRVGVLEEMLYRLFDEVGDFKNKQRDDHRALMVRIDEEVKTLRKSISQVESAQEDISVGNLDVEIVGLLWLIGGVILATVPENVTSLF